MPQNEKPGIALISLGCPKNQVDSEVMLGLLDEAGYPIVDDVTGADIVIINTCAFIEPAQEEAVEALLDMAELKENEEITGVICTGCLPQRFGQALVDEFPEIDAFVQIGAEPDIVEIVQQVHHGSRAFFEHEGGYRLTSDLPRWRSAPEWLAYVRIAEGCDRACTFCTIPSIRGPYRSRTPDDIMTEYARFVAEGVREIILIAQDTTRWGRDLDDDLSLADLLDHISTVDYDGWTRLMYAYPTALTSTVLEALAGCGSCVPYIDIPLQHASADILRRMGRPGDSASYLSLLQQIRTILPDAAIRTTFLLGFPGETDDDFEDLLDFVYEARFDRVSAFIFSPEEGTPAAQMPDQVSVPVMMDRLAELMRTQEDIAYDKNQQFVGQTMRVLIESRAPGRDIWFGRSYRDAPEIDCQVKVEAEGAELTVGRFYQVDITSAEVHDLNGEVVHTSEAFAPDR
ncbi:MAG: 30S ribosomal protein S12 methylthiotransferase RimO [Armatimonadota bacterium]